MRHVDVKCNRCCQQISVRSHQIGVCMLRNQVTEVNEKSSREERFTDKKTHVEPDEDFRCLENSS